MSQPILVHKYGGSSVADVEKMKKVAALIAARRAQGYGLVVVVSAMGDTTDELLALAKKVTANPPRRELDMLLTAGERISMALLSMALIEQGTPAISFTGSQSGIITSDDHAQARIIDVRPTRVREELAKGKVVIVAGYQGVSEKREVTTLGRGGSDTTAVAMAAALSAEACEIYSDVDGVFTADPRVVPRAHKLETLAHEEMQELAHCGAKVLNAAAVEFARAKGITIHAKSTFGGGTGTKVVSEPGPDAIRGIATDAEVALLQAERSVDVNALLDFLRGAHAHARELGRRAERHGWAIPMADVHDEGFASELQRRFGGAVRLVTDVARVSAAGRGASKSEVVKALLEAARASSAEVLDVDGQPLSSSIFVARGKLAEVARAAHAALLEG
ncbi:MAG: aspartate kinase [Deltaproteobacteria bacterium]|nr:aspartate kinase [Deltaproteobacteria bacterium]